MSNQTTAVATDRKDIRSLLASDKVKQQIAMVAPKHMTADRMARVALTVINKNPKLASCTPESLLSCLMDCAAMGLEPDGRYAHLIPYGTQCTVIFDYKGIVRLVRNSGEVSYIHADVVCQNDEFDYIFGSGHFLKHKPAKMNRGPVISVYSFVKLKDGTEDFDVMAVEDVDKVRKRSKASSSGPWVSDWNEMAKKTVFRRHSKWLPLSPELREKIERDDEPLTEAERFEAAKPIFDAPVESAPPQKVESADPATRLIELADAAGINHGEVLALLKRRNLCGEDAEEIYQVSDEVLTDIADKWDVVSAQIRMDRKGK